MKLIGIIFLSVVLFTTNTMHIKYRESFSLKENTVSVTAKGTDILYYSVNNDTIDIIIKKSDCYFVFYSGVMIGNTIVDSKLITARHCNYVPLVVK